MPISTDQLKRVPLFAGLQDKDLKSIASSMHERTFNAGDSPTVEGKSGIGFFVIESGEASVNVNGRDVRKLGAGDHFGEIALIDEGPRSATVTATTDLRCRGLAAWEFKSFVQEHPEVAWPLLETLASRLRDAEERGA
jgi:CRP-like cAMP-binding protein